MDGKVIEFFNSDKVKSRWEHGSLYYCDKCTEYIEGCSGYDSVVEISKLVRATPSAVKNRLFRARRMLKDQLKEDWHDDE